MFVHTATSPFCNNSIKDSKSKSESGGFILSECYFAFRNICLGTNISGNCCFFSLYRVNLSEISFSALTLCRLLPADTESQNSLGTSMSRLILFIRKLLICCYLYLWETVPTGVTLLNYCKLQFVVKKSGQLSMIFIAYSGSSVFTTLKHLNMACGSNELNPQTLQIDLIKNSY